MRAKLLAAVALCAAALGLARVHPFGDPRAGAEEAREGLLRGVGVPEDARRTLIARCADCHSNATHWPVYARVAPVSWMMERDVERGRAHLNLSAWSALAPDELLNLEQEIAHKTRSGAMPPLLYRMAHGQAGLTAAELEALGRLAAPANAGGQAVAEGDAARGRALFNRRCSGCHDVDANREGPHLRGVYGRRAGSVPEFGYSPALRNSGVTWDGAALEKWLRDSDAMIPGTEMGFSVAKAQERADLIAFLRSLRS